MDDKIDYEERNRRERRQMMRDTAAIAAMVGIVAGRQLSGKSIEAGAVAREARALGDAMAKELETR